MAGNGFGGGGLGVLSSWRCQLKKQPQWVKILRWDFQVGIFVDPLLFLGESTPLFFVASLLTSGPCLCKCFNTSPKSDSTLQNANLSNAINTGVCDLIFQGTLTFSGR